MFIGRRANLFSMVSRSEGQQLSEPNSPHRHLPDQDQTHAAADFLHFERKKIKTWLEEGAAVSSSSLSAELQQHHPATDFPKLNQA